MKAADLLVLHAQELVTMAGPAGPRRGEAMGKVEAIVDGAVAVRGLKIAAVGPTREIRKEFKAKHVLDAKGRAVTPGLIDPHTHLIFAGTRENEFEMRIRGVSYMEIAKAGGGINATVEKVRAAKAEELKRLARERLARMIEYGTTTAEVKSGYGLTLKDELKSLEVIRELGRSQPAELIPTFLGAHDIPREFAHDHAAYVDLVINEMIPAVARRKLAQFCDVFCEPGAFTVEDARQILTAAREKGLIPRLHAEEFVASGGAELAAELGAVSADHLMAISDNGIRALKESKVMATLLPGTSFFLGGWRYAPARRLIDNSIPVALGSDFNPGSCMTHNLQLIMTLACTQLKMTPAEALTACTVNAAHALLIGDRVGMLRVGYQADLVLWDVPTHKAIPYEFGANLAHTVIKRGKVVSGKSTDRS